MQRVLTLRFEQLKGIFLNSLLITLGFTVVGIIINFLVNGQLNELLSTDKLIENIGNFVWMTFTFFMLITCISDGTSNFDSALRFGVSRRQYFMTNMLIMVIFTLMEVLYQVIFEGGYSGSFFFSTNMLTGGVTFQNVLISFLSTILLAIFGYLYYRYGAKIYIIAFLLPFVLGITAGVLPGVMDSHLMVRLINALNIVVKYINWILSAISLLFVGAYYHLIMKTEIK